MNIGLVFKTFSHQFKRAFALSVMSVVGASSVLSVTALSKQVHITDGDKITNVITLSSEPVKILDHAGIKLGENDDVVVETKNLNYIDMEVKRAFNVYLTCDGVSKTVALSHGTVEDAIIKSGITLNVNDIVVPSLTTELCEDMNITVSKMHAVKLTIDGSTRDVSICGGNVIDALNIAGFNIGSNDILNVARYAQVTDNMEITVDRVEFREYKKVEKIPYDTITRTSNSLYDGTSTTVAGSCGEREVTIREKLINGSVVETSEISSTTLKEPTSAQVTIGTKTGSISAGYSRVNGDGTITDHNGNVISYSSVLTGSGTAYTSSSGATTSTGALAQVGRVAVNPNIIPYGSKLYICSPDGSFVYGYAIASDTGGALMNGSALVDVYYNTTAECYQFGRRTLNVYILD